MFAFLENLDNDIRGALLIRFCFDSWSESIRLAEEAHQKQQARNSEDL